MIVEQIHRFIWGIPLLILILGTGCYLTVCTGWAQLRYFRDAQNRFFSGFQRNWKNRDVSSFQALCTALAATVGTGNLAGVAGAIALGGPGAIFWMWVSGFLAMATKFAEAVLAVRFRIRENGEYRGGPMYMIRRGLGAQWGWLAGVYSFLGVTAAFGVGNATQINAAVTGINQVIVSLGGQESKVQNFMLGAAFAVIIGLLLFGGAKRIGVAAEILVPFVAGAYIFLAVGILVVRFRAVPAAFLSIFKGAFSPRGVTGGVVGSTFQTIRIGISRGVFTNEAGMGTASIAHGGAAVDHPVQQGLMGIVEVFLDTIVICTLTAIVILVSGVPIEYGSDSGAYLTIQAFSRVYGPWSRFFLAGALCSFAFATVLGWGLYGARCAQFLFGSGAWSVFAVFQTLMVVVSAVLKTEVIWLLAEIVNGLMAVPNLTALILLSPELRRLIQDYEKYKLRNSSGIAAGGTYENINQRKSLRTISYEKVSSHGSGR